MTADNRQLQYIDLGVGRMTCDDCVRTVTDALESVPGVKSAGVSLERRSARVEADPSVEPERLTAAVRASGYNAFVRPPRTAA
ncbi:MAG: cation transporter [Chloroflexota bacterium]